MKHFQRHSVAEWFGLLKSAASAWSDDYAPSMGAALSYYSVFSMAPLILLVISIAGLVFGEDAARGELFAQLQGLMGTDAAKAIQDMLAAMSKPRHGVTATVIGIGVLFVGATSVFGELQDALDRIWRAPDRIKADGIWKLLRSRVLSFGMVLGIAFLLMVSLVTTAALSALGRWWGGFFGTWEFLLQFVNLAVGYGLTTVVFAMIYKFMPRVRVQWHDVWWGAAITAGLFTIGKFLIGLYIGKTGVASGFGAAGSIAVVFVWVYYSAQIFLLGAEFTWAYAQKFGSRKHAPDLVADTSAPSRTDDSPAGVRPVSAVRTAEVTASPNHATPVALAKVGLSLGAALGIRYLLPKLILRLAAGKTRRVLKARSKAIESGKPRRVASSR